jgi:indole-3-glycerol phosphate synthase
MADILDTILAEKAREVAQLVAGKPPAALRAEAEAAQKSQPPRDFAGALRARTMRNEPAVIAEIKKASPSRGVIRADFDVAAIAASYAGNGAACLSVLTDEKFFQGNGGNLAIARAACKLPLLRKDFIIDASQVWQARALGADCILLIVAALDDARLKAFQALAAELGMAALIEVHNAAEMERAAKLDARLVGVNNRDLRSFETRLETTLDLIAGLPEEALLVTESGIHAPEHVKRMQSAGVNAFLVGEAFMRAQDPGVALANLFFGATPV